MDIDHIIVVAETLEAGADHVEAALGARPVAGGRHEGMGTHNCLLSLGPRTYLEVMAIDPEAPPPDRPRWLGLDSFAGPPRLAAWMARTSQLDTALAAAPAGAGEARPFSRGRYRWRLAIPDGGGLLYDGVCPVLIEWERDAHPADDLPDSGCHLARIDLVHPRIRALIQEFAELERLARVRLVDDPEPALVAVIETPLGNRLLR